MDSTVRTFDTGANRSPDQHRDDPEGFLSPLVIDRFNQYMTKNRKLPDGSLRDSDNWQKGIPLNAYMKGAWRHFLHFWTRHRGHPVTDPGAAVNIEEDLCALMFNVQGYLHETVKRRLLHEAVVSPTKEERAAFRDALEKSFNRREITGHTYIMASAESLKKAPAHECHDQRCPLCPSAKVGSHFDYDGYYKNGL